jgi:hypothetical protein
MQVTQASMLQSLRAVRSFLDGNAPLGEIAKSGSSKQLDQAIAQLDAHAENQTGRSNDAKGSTREQRVLKATLLRDHMKPIARIAKAHLSGTPNIESLSMPKGWYRGERLAAAAKGMGQTAAKFAPALHRSRPPRRFRGQAQRHGRCDGRDDQPAHGQPQPRRGRDEGAEGEAQRGPASGWHSRFVRPERSQGRSDPARALELDQARAADAGPGDVASGAADGTVRASQGVTTMPKHGPNVWVVCKDGRFSIKEQGRGGVLIEPTTQRDAIDVGRMLARENRSELIIQGKNGKIRAKDSHGFDSFPPKG